MAQRRRRAAETQHRLKMPQTERLATGIPGLDEILGGGLIEGRLYVLTGLPGTGKTVLTAQLCFERARRGDKSLIVSMLSEAHGPYVASLRNMGFFEERYFTREIKLVSAQKAIEDGGLPVLRNLIVSTLRAERPRLLIVDSLSTPSEFAPSSLAFKVFLRTSARWLRWSAAPLSASFPNPRGNRQIRSISSRTGSSTSAASGRACAASD